MVDSPPIPVIDLFAGPGGLGEGFAAVTRPNGGAAFDLRLSIEKDAHAHATLELRSFARQFERGRRPDAYYEFLRRADQPLTDRRRALFAAFPREAEQAAAGAWHMELGPASQDQVYERIAAALGGARHWVLLGGPPCQAYSLVGRARRGRDPNYRPDDDPRQRLYVEYLQVLADHQPTVFLMENVKGLLSATLNNQRLFERMCADLADPCAALAREGRRFRPRPALPGRHPGAGASAGVRYRLRALVSPAHSDRRQVADYVVRMEQHGIPQARHRLLIVGLREDLGDPALRGLPRSEAVPISRVIGQMPRLRSGLSRGQDGPEAWVACLRTIPETFWFQQVQQDRPDVAARLVEVVGELALPRADRGAEFVRCAPRIAHDPDWYLDPQMDGVCNHASRDHMASDLHRYLYAASFAATRDRSPLLGEFPSILLPRHTNAQNALDGSGMFADRFRVQRGNRPATTVTCHISHDGHYYIHPDPSQCRSLTVREAARLQTFPDNYFFCGPRTEQYLQVGNAVPPLLALAIGRIIRDMLASCGVGA